MMLRPTITLTAAQIAFYHENGYLSLPALTTAEEIVALRKIYDHLFDIKAGRAEGNHFDLGGTDAEDQAAVLPQILRPSKYAPELLTTLLRVNAQAVAHQLGGPECVLGFDHAINKPAHSPAPTPWHQDEAYWGDSATYDHRMSIWIPFQDVNEDNGCMQFIPKSQHLEVLPHHCINHDPRIHGLEIDAGVADLSNRAICPLRAGGCTIHTSRVLHYTAPNNSDAPRRAYIINAQTPQKTLATSRNFYWNKAKTTAREQRARRTQA